MLPWALGLSHEYPKKHVRHRSIPGFKRLNRQQNIPLLWTASPDDSASESEVSNFDGDKVPSLIFSRQQLESKMDEAATEIRELVYGYAVSDREDTLYRFKTEARIRSNDYSQSPVLSLVRMVRRLCQKRKGVGYRWHYPDSTRSLIRSDFRISAREGNVKKRKVKVRDVMTPHVPLEFSGTHLTDDSLI